MGTATANVFEFETENSVTSGDVDFIVDPGEEGQDSATDDLDEAGEASVTILCPGAGIPPESDIVIDDFEQHDIIARFLGTPTHAASESDTLQFICSD